MSSAIAGPLAVQRDGPPAPALAPTALASSERIRTAATSRLFKLAAYNAAADSAIMSYRDKRTTYATNWGAAWDRHNKKLQEGGEAASDQNLIEGIVIGVVAAVVISAGAALVFPTAAAASAATGSFWAFNVGTNTASSVVGGLAASQIGRPGVPGPSTGRSDAEAEGWRRIAEAELTARLVAGIAPKIGIELGDAEYCIAQVNAHIEGRGFDMPWPQTLDMVSTMTNWERGLAGFDGEIETQTSRMAAFGAAATAWTVPSIDDIEKHIWRAWMSRLNNDTDEALDQDVIQKYLVRLGLIPNHFYMTDEDQHEAVRNARAQLAAAAPPP